MPPGDVLIHAGITKTSQALSVSNFTPAGDFAVRCKDDTQIKNFNVWLGSQNYKHKIVIAGFEGICNAFCLSWPLTHPNRNHEYVFNKYTSAEIQSKYLTNCTYLQDSSLVVEGITLYGTPWNGSTYALTVLTLRSSYTSCSNMSFSSPKAKLSEKWALIPAGVDILVTHMPPSGILDLAGNGRHWYVKYVVSQPFLTSLWQGLQSVAYCRN